MDSAEIGRRLGTMLNSHDSFTPAEKGVATGEIVNYIREIESQLTEAKAIIKQKNAEIAGKTLARMEASATISELDRRVIDLEKENCQQQALMQRVVDAEKEALFNTTSRLERAIDDMAKHLDSPAAEMTRLGQEMGEYDGD